jgi:succinyl-diaminopimelate desuccinylase
MEHMRHNDLLTSLIKISSHKSNELEVGLFLSELLKMHGFNVSEQRVAGNRLNIFAAKGSVGRPVLFYGHMDTVPLVNGWTRDPFEAEIEGNKLYGLGAYDMKGGITAFIDACINTQANVKIFLAVDEENISAGAWKAVRENPDFFADVELIVSAEPNFGHGLHGITRGRTGRSLYKASFVGNPVHIARYRDGIDAIEKLGNFIESLYANREVMFKSPETVAQVRKVEAEATGMSVCGEATAEIEVLMGYQDSADDIRMTLAELDGITEVTLKDRKTPYLEGYFFESFPHQKQIAQIIKSTTGKEMILHQRTSVGDDNVLATLGIPVITWGPDGGNAHAPDEWVDLDSLATLTKLYIKILRQLY